MGIGEGNSSGRRAQYDIDTLGKATGKASAEHDENPKRQRKTPVILVAVLVGLLVVIGLMALGIWSLGIARQMEGWNMGRGTETMRRHDADEVDEADETDEPEAISLIVMTKDDVPEDGIRAILSEYGAVDGQMADAGIWLVTPTGGIRGSEQLERLGERMENEHPEVIESTEPNLPVKLSEETEPRKRQDGEDDSD